MDQDPKTIVFKHQTFDVALSHTGLGALNRRREPNGPLARLFRWFRRVLWD